MRPLISALSAASNLPPNCCSSKNISLFIRANSFCNSIRALAPFICVRLNTLRNFSPAAFTSFSNSLNAPPCDAGKNSIGSFFKLFCNAVLAAINLLKLKSDILPLLLSICVCICTNAVLISSTLISVIFVPALLLNKSIAFLAALNFASLAAICLSIKDNSASASSLFAPCTIISCRAIRNFSAYSLLLVSNKIPKFAVVISSSFSPAKKLGYCALKSAIKLLRIWFFSFRFNVLFVVRFIAPTKPFNAACSACIFSTASPLTKSFVALTKFVANTVKSLIMPFVFAPIAACNCSTASPKFENAPSVVWLWRFIRSKN